jgi:hypothetical protein
MAWALHWLEAEGELRPWQAAIEADIDAAHSAFGAIVEPPQLDIVIQRTPGFGIPEYGMGGHAYRRRCFGLSVDPDNKNFEPSLAAGVVRRLVVHEAHHCLRMHSKRGYGMTLGEALVSEGLAGQFTGLALGTAPEAWEKAVDLATLCARIPDDTLLASHDYDHNGWFYGTKSGNIPRWLGYTMGFELVGAWMRKACPSGMSLVDVSADEVLAAGLPVFRD